MSLAAAPGVAAVADELGADVDEGVLILGRTVGDSRSRSTLGGRGVPAAVLDRVGEALAVRHGQNDQQRIRSAPWRRGVLDEYCGSAVATRLADYRDCYDELQQVQSDLARIGAEDREAAQQADLLRHGLAEISALAPVAGEEDELAAEEQRLGHVVELRQLAEQAHQALRADDGPDAEQALGAAVGALTDAARHDPAVGGWLDTLHQALALVSDAAADLAGYGSALEADPARLAQVQQRRADLAALCRKYGDTAADVLQWAASAEEKLLGWDTRADRMSALAAQRDDLRARLGQLAVALSGARAAGAERLGEAITAELHHLAMPDAVVQVRLAAEDDAAGLPLPDGRVVAMRRDGIDDVEILLRPHAGAPFRPIGEGASGGEASRTMLALEVALAAANPVPVFVFDEVDAGIGGRAAVEVGRRLAQLARHAQVLVVTHLPQVAAFADQHIVVRKAGAEGITASSVVSLAPAEQQQELARMLAGMDDSATAVAHAGELIDLAARERAEAERSPR